MSETALYDDQGRFLGHSIEVAHHTTGNRAWCLEGLPEWCYPDTPCDSCQRARQGDPWETIAALRAQVQALESRRACGMPYDQCRFSEDDRRALDGGAE